MHSLIGNRAFWVGPNVLNSIYIPYIHTTVYFAWWQVGIESSKEVNKEKKVKWSGIAHARTADMHSKL